MSEAYEKREGEAVADRPLAVVFDMDGLMFNTEDIYFLVGDELLKRRGHRFSRELSDAMMGRPPLASFEIMIEWHRLSDSPQSLVGESEDLFIEMIQGRIQPMPGLLELLDALERHRIPKAIATSSSRRTLRAVLGCFNMEPRFHFTLTADDITHGKPHPEIYLLAAKKFGIPPGRMVVLEDSENGCRAAAAAGAWTVAVPAPHSARHDFSSARMRIAGLSDPTLYRLLNLPLPEIAPSSREA
ncbi:MAG: HAD-IA family hydrolase [Thermogutta sp.]